MVPYAFTAFNVVDAQRGALSVSSLTRGRRTSSTRKLASPALIYSRLRLLEQFIPSCWLDGKGGFHEA